MSANSVKISLAAIKLAIYPIGSIYTSIGTTSPATLFGGTWEAFGAGKVLVGIDSGDTDFDTIGETGGAKTVTLTGAQSGTSAHTHGTTSYLWGDTPGTSGRITRAAGPTTYTGGGGGGVPIDNAAEANATAAHTNLQPYIVVYFWKRTA